MNAATKPVRGLRVLIVEDDADSRDFLHWAVEAFGAEVIDACDAREAFARLLAEHPDIVLSDIGMPGETGYSLMQRVRALAAEQGGTVPSAAVTAFSSPEHRREAKEAGFDEVLGKPIDLDALGKLLERLAELARSRAA